MTLFKKTVIGLLSAILLILVVYPPILRWAEARHCEDVSNSQIEWSGCVGLKDQVNTIPCRSQALEYPDPVIVVIEVGTLVVNKKTTPYKEKYEKSKDSCRSDQLPAVIEYDSPCQNEDHIGINGKCLFFTTKAVPGGGMNLSFAPGDIHKEDEKK